MRFGAKAIFPFSIHPCAAMCTKATMENLFKTFSVETLFGTSSFVASALTKGAVWRVFPILISSSLAPYNYSKRFIFFLVILNNLYPRITQFPYGNLLGNLQSIGHFRYIKIQLNSEAYRTRTKEMNKHDHSVSFIYVLLASLPS